jgi:hypothetical protein
VREQVIEDTLAGAAEAKRAWTERGMIEDISVGLIGVTNPTIVVIGDHDQLSMKRSALSVRPLPPASEVPSAGRGLVTCRRCKRRTR